MPSIVARRATVIVVTLLLAMPVASIGGLAWGNGSSASPEWPNFGIHDITADIALRTATYTSPELLTWMTDWYIRNATDYGPSFDPASKGPTATDNINAYTDDPDSDIQDWDNHTLYLNRRSWWDPAEGDAASRVSQLYNQTRNHIYGWLMNGSVRYDADQHRAAYYAGLMAHYVMDITQFGHTDWTRLDHSHPMDDPQGATYHSYYEARSWSDRALRTVHVDLMSRQLPETMRVSDPAQVVRDLAQFISARHGPDVQYLDVDTNTVVLGSTYVKMLELFVTDYDAQNSYNGARGYSAELWNLTLDNLFAGMDNLTGLWTSAFLDARDMFRADAADVVVEQILFDPAVGAYEGLDVDITAQVRNVGNTSSGNFNVALFIDNESVSEALIDLDAGQMMSVAFIWTAEGGEHEVRVVADVYQQVPEGNKTNNVGWKMYSVAEAHHASSLAAETATLTLLQDDSGTFNLTLTNLGNKVDTFRIYLETFPGAIDFSMTLLVDEQVTLPPGGHVDFIIDVTTLLENPVGPRYFQVVAEGGNSTSQVTLAVVIEERNVAPYIEVEYDFYGNVSVPMIFDASETWDRNGDPISFEWIMDNVTIGNGPMMVRVFDEEGDYVIELVASDGMNERRETLEVSILDAIPPRPTITLLDWDKDAAHIGWTVWNTANASKYFSEYRVYASENNTDPDKILAEGNMVANITLVHVNNAIVIMPYDYWYSDEVHIVVTTVNIYGLMARSNAIGFNPEIRHAYRGDPWGYGDGIFEEPLFFYWLDRYNTTKYSVEFEWREWRPIGEGGYYDLSVRDFNEPGSPNILMETITDLRDTHRIIMDLSPDMHISIDLRYYSLDGDRYFSTGISFDLKENVPPNVQIAPIVDMVEGKGFMFHVIGIDLDGNITKMVIDWGDGSPISETTSDHLNVSKTYEKMGEYNITVEVWDNDGDSTLGFSSALVKEPKESSSSIWDSVIAVALIIFVALLGVIMGHFSGYYRIGREGEGKAKTEEPDPSNESKEEPEPEQTAEEIISELEEELGDDKDREYFDHEPSVSELEDMIPKDHD
jgi:hypothetical protein